MHDTTDKEGASSVGGGLQADRSPGAACREHALRYLPSVACSFKKAPAWAAASSFVA